MTSPLYHRLEKAFKETYLLPLTLLRYGTAAQIRHPVDHCRIRKFEDLLVHLQQRFIAALGVSA